MDENAIPQAGQQAPDFTLPDADGVEHHLGDQRGRWAVVYFYPTDDTPGCTTEACSFRDANDLIAETGASVWGISPQGVASKAAFRSKYGLTFPLLADEDHAVAEAYGSWVEKVRHGERSMGVARRTFLVAPDGTIADVWEQVKPEGHAEDVLATVRAAQAARAAGSTTAASA
jgi:peroxiredoxin Q/BCP